MRGVDCSGLTYNIYKKVYHKHLKRNSDDQRKENCRKVSKGKLQEGDLVFFHNGKNKRTATHVGIYLKDNRFIHASTSRGVIVSRLDEPYYRRVWMKADEEKVYKAIVMPSARHIATYFGITVSHGRSCSSRCTDRKRGRRNQTERRRYQNDTVRLCPQRKPIQTFKLFVRQEMDAV